MAQKLKGRSKDLATKTANARESVSKVAKKGRAVADESVRKSRRAIQSKPLTAVGAGIAAGAAAGVVAGVLLQRKRAASKKGAEEKESVAVEATTSSMADKGSEDDDDELEEEES